MSHKGPGFAGIPFLFCHVELTTVASAKLQFSTQIISNGISAASDLFECLHNESSLVCFTFTHHGIMQLCVCKFTIPAIAAMGLVGIQTLYFELREVKKFISDRKSLHDYFFV